MINRFRPAQDRAVAFLVEVVGPATGLRLPTSNREWVEICAECGVSRKTIVVNGVEVYAHGFGLELNFNDLQIDFDWGDSGEPDGFNSWWLLNFCRRNAIDFDCRNHSQIRSWLEEAAAQGELSRDSELFYSPNHRAIDGPGKVV
jgi:hypothetical protein